MASDARDALTKEAFPLPPGWRWSWLDDVMSIRGGAQPPADEFYSEPGPGRVRFVQIRDFDGDGHLTFIDDGPKWRHCSPNDILIARYGASLGRILTGLTGAYNVALAKASPLDGVAHSYLLYLLKSTFFQDPLAALGARSVQAGFNKRDLANIPVPVPPLATQHRIADVLGKLDDKIELNRRMNRTLEKMAAAIFKSWFIDFDPVHAKAEGRDPNLPAEIADLFPDTFEDSDLGAIPKGWAVAPLKDLADVNARSIKKNYPHTRIQYLDISSVSLGNLDQTTSYDLVDAPSRAKRLVHTGDTIWSCVRPNRKAYFYIDRPADNLVVSTGFAVLSPRAVPASYLHQWVTTQAFVDYLTAYATGAAYPAVKADTFETAKMLLPAEGVLKAFHNLVGPFRARIAYNQRQNSRLAVLRDTLLPMLLSGELRVVA